MESVWAVLLFGLGGVLVGGTFAMWKVSRVIAVLLAACAAVAVAAGVLRLGFL